ncbi:MAG: JAB domain-containing protein, partial [Verrucomicrobiota bacterium]
MPNCDHAKLAVAYWHRHITNQPHFNPDVECLVALLLNSRRRIIAHHLISTGTLDCLLVHPRECFRAAIIGAAHSMILMHNHPSGDPTPSEADIKATAELRRAGLIVQVEISDHISVGRPSRRCRKGYIS